VLTADRMPWDITAAGPDGEKAAPAARPRPGRHLIAVMLLGAAARTTFWDDLAIRGRC
jgi:hypothetical protein